MLLTGIIVLAALFEISRWVRTANLENEDRPRRCNTGTAENEGGRLFYTWVARDGTTDPSPQLAEALADTSRFILAAHRGGPSWPLTEWKGES